MKNGFCNFCTNQAGVSRTDREVVAECCSRCHAILPIGLLCEVDTDLFAGLFYDEIVVDGRIRERFRGSLALSSDGSVLSAGSCYPMFPPRLPARRRVFFAEDINHGSEDSEGVFTTNSLIARFGPRAVVEVGRLADLNAQV